MDNDPPAEPEIAVSVDGTEISAGQSAATDFGSVTMGGAGPTKVFTVENQGTVPLTLDAPSLPTGYTVTESLEASLAPGASDTFTVRLDSSVVGTKDGSIGLANNDADENPFHFPITGTVNPSPPTAVAVAIFHAILVGGDRATLQWTTGVEFDLLGFHLEQQVADGSWVRINPALIPALGWGRPTDYAVENLRRPKAGTDRYHLIGVDFRGGRRTLAETVAESAPLVTLGRDGEGLVFHVQGVPATRPVLESTSDLVRGPWRAGSGSAPQRGRPGHGSR